MTNLGRGIACLLLAACVGCSSSTPHVVATCGPPPPTAAPQAFLVFPEAGATGVPDNAGIVVVTSGDGFVTSSSLQIAAASAAIAVGATSVPSPLPTPNAVPTGFGSQQLVAVSIPTLSPATTYTVGYRYNDYPPSQPRCAEYSTLTVGSFTTQ